MSILYNINFKTGKKSRLNIGWLFILILIGFTFSRCELFNPEVVPKNGTWEWKSTGEYADEIDFYVNNGRIIQPVSDTWIRSLRFKMVFDGFSITSSTNSTIEVEDGKFKYESGTLLNGKTTIEGEFTSPTTCAGKVHYERESFSVTADGYFNFKAVWIRSTW